ncbi:MAG: hypothetical protein KIS67_00230 [Verrucomicrobiae bacterium]|nr:hypothetical protein [Verrucomicrobiae bacterium]
MKKYIAILTVAAFAVVAYAGEKCCADKAKTASVKQATLVMQKVSADKAACASTVTCADKTACSDKTACADKTACSSKTACADKTECSVKAACADKNVTACAVTAKADGNGNGSCPVATACSGKSGLAKKDGARKIVQSPKAAGEAGK